MLTTLMAGIRATERVLLAVVMIAMSIMFFINVVVRETNPRLATELAWIEEATLFALAWLVFIGLGLTLERRRHIAMTVFADSLPPRIAFALHKLINVSGIVVGALLTKFSFEFALFVFHSGQISPTLGYSMVVLYAPLPIGFALLTLRYVLEFLGFQNRFAIQDVIADH